MKLFGTDINQETQIKVVKTMIGVYLFVVGSVIITEIIKFFIK